MSAVYTLVCPRLTDDKGNRTGGCGKGWTSATPDATCSTCGKPTSLRGQYRSTPLRSPAGRK